MVKTLLLPIFLLALLSCTGGYRVTEEMDTGDPVAPAAPSILKRTIVEEGEDSEESDEDRRETVLREIEDVMRYAKRHGQRAEESEELHSVDRRGRPGFFNAFKNMLKDEVDIGDLFGKRRISVDTSCRKPYPQSSTMCYYPDDSRAKDKGVRPEVRQIILDEHNKYRKNVNPPAKAMQKLYWCPELEELAQKWAQVCSSSFHDRNEQRMVPGWGINIGQNAAYGQKNWQQVVGAWHSEVQYFRYGASYGSDWGKIGHYTQVVRDIATCIGCGFALCEKGPNYICNYAFGNPFPKRFGFPYVSGPSCSDCPGKCSDKLCDCNGLVCKNGGTLDPKSCSCKCKGKLWTGRDCTKKNQAACKDPAYCTKPQPAGYRGKCKQWTNVPEECPKMCGVC